VNMKHIASLLSPFLLAITLLLPQFSHAADNTQQPASLYSRLGGYDAVTAVVNDLLPRLMADPQLGRFWENRGTDGLLREKQLLINFIVSSAGGPLLYTGRDMVVSHKGMKISESDWRIFMGHLHATLDKFKLPKREYADVIGFIDSTKPLMVER
jgi:hemoglobin